MREKQRKFVDLRAKGLSYVKISEQLKVSTRTLIRWSRKFKDEIGNLQQIEYEALREEYMLSREQRIKLLGTQLQMVSAEIMSRDYSKVPTWRLYKIQGRLMKELEEEKKDITFAGEAARGGTLGEKTLSMGGMLRKRIKWKG